MKRKLILTTFLLTMTIFFVGQTSGLNKFDSNGKKDGKWIVYLDRNWKKVDDSTKAIFFRYTYFDHGVNIYPMGECGGKGYKLEPGTVSNKAILLDGEYKMA